MNHQDALEAWLRTAAAEIHAQAGSLTALDQAIGDGDHGTNMDRGFTAIVAALDRGGWPVESAEPGSGPALAALLRGVGKTLISTVGGASGPLYGTAFLRAGGAFAAVDDPGRAEAVAALEAAAGGIGALGKSSTGEKTMLDALVPAAAAARSALEAGANLGGILRAAHAAAAAGATGTIPMLATKGRASYLGERSIGHQDPGATSAALLLDTLAKTVGAG
jgi:phosphoenolpyruvate---glycerone phosphotransferase subunit DhaL